MGERYDNFKEEMYYATNAIGNWYKDGDNRFAFWLITIVTCVATCFVYTGVALALRTADHAVSGTLYLTVKQGNPCLAETGLIRDYAPAPCYEDKLDHPPQHTERANAAAAFPKNSPPVYDPPCVRDKLPGCTDKIYSKRLVEGLVGTVTFNSDEKATADDHLQPDYTEVKFDSEYDSVEPPNSEKFCGNVLHKFTPGKKIKMVINESKQSDYNG